MKYNIEENKIVVEFGKTKINDMFKEHLIKFLESCLSVQVKLFRDFSEDEEIMKEDEVTKKTRDAAQKQEESIVPKSANYSDVSEDELEDDTLPPLDATENQNMKEWVPETRQVEETYNEEIEDEFGDDL